MNLLDPGEPLSVERGVEEHQLSTGSRECCFVSAMHQNNFVIHTLFFESAGVSRRRNSGP